MLKVEEAALHTLAVLGAGTMGRSVTEIAIRRGFEVLLYDPFPRALDDARRAFGDTLSALEKAERLEAPRPLIERRLHCHQTLEPIAAADWVIETAPEQLDLKCELLAQADTLAARALLATTSTTLSVTRIAAATSRPGDVIGLHFLHPATAAQLVEVSPGLATRPGVVERATALVTQLGKTPLTTRDRPGFIVERSVNALSTEALLLAQQGVGIETIDAIARGMGYRLGPFERLDLIGLDVSLATGISLYEALFHPPRHRPSVLLRQLVDARRLGRSSGHGFYDYRQSHDMTPMPPKRNDAAPRALVVGGTPTADELRARFDTVERPADADLILDARTGPVEKIHARLAEEVPVATLMWGHSASAVVRGYRRSLVGFSLVPPIGDGSLVELCPPLSGRDEATTLAQAFFEGNGVATTIQSDRPGGIGFRLLSALIDEAATAVADGMGTPETIDGALKLGAGHPFGPLEWSERLGLRPLLSALEGLHGETGEERFRPHPLLKRMVAAGVEGWR